MRYFFFSYTLQIFNGNIAHGRQWWKDDRYPSIYEMETTVTEANRHLGVINTVILNIVELSEEDHLHAIEKPSTINTDKQVYLKQPNGSLYPVTVVAVGDGDAIIEISAGRQIVVKSTALVFVETQPVFQI